MEKSCIGNTIWISYKAVAFVWTWSSSTAIITSMKITERMIDFGKEGPGGKSRIQLQPVEPRTLHSVSAGRVKLKKKKPLWSAFLALNMENIPKSDSSCYTRDLSQGIRCKSDKWNLLEIKYIPVMVIGNTVLNLSVEHFIPKFPLLFKMSSNNNK